MLASCRLNGLSRECVALGATTNARMFDQLGGLGDDLLRHKLFVCPQRSKLSDKSYIINVVLNDLSAEPINNVSVTANRAVES
jgi:hypothetical protein